MVQKYQNEIAPIFYYGKSPKTNEKDLKIPNLLPPDWGQPYWMTLYNLIYLIDLCDLSLCFAINELFNIDFVFGFSCGIGVNGSSILKLIS